MKVGNQKGSRAALAALAAGLMVFAACGDDNDVDPNAPTPVPTNTTAPAPTNTTAPAPTNTPAGPTDTPGAAATPTPTTEAQQPTNTPGGGQPSDEIEAVIAGVVAGFADLAAIAQPEGAGGGAGLIPPVEVPCPSGQGTLATSCSDGGGSAQLTIEFDNCLFEDPGVSRSTLDGTFTEIIQSSCLNPVPPTGTPIRIEYVGDILYEDLTNGITLDITEDVTMDVTPNADGSVEIDVQGTASSSCFGSASFGTIETIFVPAGGGCPTAGLIDMTVNGDAVQAQYTSSGGFEIDLGADGSVDAQYDTCEVDVPPSCG